MQIQRTTLPACGLDAEICFQGETFQINSRVFSAYSGRFFRMFRSLTMRTITLSEDVSRDTVVEFIKACQMKPYSISVRNAHELSYLSQAWEVDVVAQEVCKFLEEPSNALEHLIPSILFRLRHGEATDDLERVLRSNFLALVRRGDLHKLPLNLLERVIHCDGEEEHFRDLFEFRLRCLDHHGPRASVLFVNYDLARLSPADLEILRGDRNFLWDFAGPSAGGVIATLVDEHRKLSKSVRDQVGTISSLKSEMAQLRQLIEGQVLQRQSEFSQKLTQIDSDVHCQTEASKLRELVALTSRELMEMKMELECLEAQPPYGFPFSGTNRFQGILQHLRHKCPTLLEVKASSEYRASTVVPVSQLLSIAKNTWYFSTQPGGDEHWIEFRVQKFRFKVSHYSLKCPLQLRSLPRHWILEGSVDGKQWATIDEKPDNRCLFEGNREVTFGVGMVMWSQCIRLRHVGPANNDFHCLSISGFEIFDVLLSWDVA
jgi:hypothetical protein